MSCGWGVSKAGNLTKCVHPRGTVEWKVPIVCFIPLCVVRFGSEQIGREGSAAASTRFFVERSVAVLANTDVLSISISLSTVIIAIATTISIGVIIIIIILLALDPRRRQVDEYPLLL